MGPNDWKIKTGYRRAALFAVTVASGICSSITASAQAVSIDTVLIGDPGNPNDSTGYGSVSYTYAIGRTEISVDQYAAFLNAVAAVDTYGLYNLDLNANENIRGIRRYENGPFWGYVVEGPTTHPVTYVSWFDAARFANWMSNGQPSGPQGNATTENGAYALNGATSGVGFTKNAINPNTGEAPLWWIPSEDEWYKAAYYDPGVSGPADDYWLFPTQSDSAPGNVVGPAANQANYFDGKFSKTQSNDYSTTQNYLTPGGDYSGSSSYYGTFDQGGNVWELTDGVFSTTSRIVRGGSWDSTGDSFGVSTLQSSTRDLIAPNAETPDIGFRLATVPEPSAGLLLGVGGIVLWLARRKV